MDIVRRTTIADVARDAGVSIKSVSRVINGEPNVSDKLRDNVQKAIDALQFVPDMAARSLAGSRTFMIAAWFDNPSPHYIVQIQHGAMQACRETGYHLVIEDLTGSASDIDTHVRAVLQTSRTDGVILTPPLVDEGRVMDLLEERAIPYIRIAPFSFEGRAPAVCMDDAAAAGEVLRHLASHGHRRLGLINGPERHGAARARRAGFLAAAAQMQGDPLSITEAQGDFSFLSGTEAAVQLLQDSHRPTAIFAANDDMGTGAVAGANRLNLDVPRDVAIVGFDDSWIAQSMWPMLTTVHQPIGEMAYQAARILIDRSLPRTGDVIFHFDHRLVLRDSG